MTRVSERVHEQLRRDILEGRLAVGEPVPSERTLSEDLGVSRHAVREALKRLQQAGLVAISQGGATRVLDWRDSGGLEVLLDLAGVGGTGSGRAPDEVIRSALEMRLSVGVDAARRCALRGAVGEREGIRALARETAAAVEAGDADGSDEGYITLWRAIVTGSQNLAYRLALNSLLVAVAAHPEVVTRTRPRDAPGVRTLGDAIAAGDGEDAATAAHRLLEPDTHLVP